MNCAQLDGSYFISLARRSKGSEDLGRSNNFDLLKSPSTKNSEGSSGEMFPQYIIVIRKNCSCVQHCGRIQ